MPEAYCVKCKKKVEIKDAKKITMKNGKPATQGKCPKCSTKVFRIGA
jgi:DNA-directed RNA polymerase subunit RPC12/RpoP